MTERTFYHPDLGPWVAIDDASPERMEYPQGTREIQPSPGPGHTFNGEDWVKTLATLADLRSRKIAAVVAAADELMFAGAPADGGLHVALDDGSRADLTAMATTATAALAGGVSWPDSYSRGWITIENVRIPLATPAAGLTLAASVGDWYAAIVQHRRDLKDAALAAEDASALEAIDEAAGWPV